MQCQELFVTIASGNSDEVRLAIGGDPMAMRLALVSDHQITT
jgi:hypothetical protein